MCSAQTCIYEESRFSMGTDAGNGLPLNRTSIQVFKSWRNANYLVHPILPRLWLHGFLSSKALLVPSSPCQYSVQISLPAKILLNTLGRVRCPFSELSWESVHVAAIEIYNCIEIHLLICLHRWTVSSLMKKVTPHTSLYSPNLPKLRL